MLKNSSTLAVFVPINFSNKLGFVSANGLRETYFVDALRICEPDMTKDSCQNRVVQICQWKVKKKLLDVNIR